MKKKLLAILLAAMLVAVMLPTAFAATTSLAFATPVIYKNAAALKSATGIDASGYSGPFFVMPFTINDPELDSNNKAKEPDSETAKLNGSSTDVYVTYKASGYTGGFVWFAHDELDNFDFGDALTINLSIEYVSGSAISNNASVYTVGNDFWTNYMGYDQIINSIKIDSVTVYAADKNNTGYPAVQLKVTTDPTAFIGDNSKEYETTATLQLMRNDKEIATTDFYLNSNNGLYTMGFNGWRYNINMNNLRDAKVGDQIKITVKAEDKNEFTATSDAYTLTIDQDLLDKISVAYPTVDFGNVTALNEQEAKDAAVVAQYADIEGGVLYIPFEYFPGKYQNYTGYVYTYDLTIATKNYNATNLTGWQLSLAGQTMEAQTADVLDTYKQEVALDYGTYFKGKVNGDTGWTGQAFYANVGDVWVITVSLSEYNVDYTFTYELTLTEDLVKVLTTGEGSVVNKLGDINADGAVNTKDAQLLLKHIVGLETLTAEQKARTLLLISGSTEVGTKHVSNVLRIIVGLDLIS